MSSESVSSEPVLLDMRGAGRFLGLSYWQLYALVKEGELPVVKVGVKFYFRRAALLRWAERAETKYRR